MLFKTFFSPLLKTFAEILKSQKISKKLREKLTWMLFETLVLLTMFGVVITGVAVLVKAIR